MAFYWDSQRAHSGCMRLWDMTAELGKLSLNTPPTTAPSRLYQLRKVPRVPSANNNTAAPSASRSRRVLLPAVTLDEQQDQPTCGGYLFVLDDAESENTKVRVVRDLRNKQDLLASFPDADPQIVQEVWGRVRSFSAASSILSSLLNSNHHVGGALEIDLRDESLWPALSGLGRESKNESGWELVKPPEGEEWELLDIEGISLNDTTDSLLTGSEIAPAVNLKPKVTGKSFKDVLLQDLLELGGEAGIWLSPNPPAESSVVLATIDRKTKKVKAEEIYDDDGWDADEEYFMCKAVGARSRRYNHKDRMTETAKVRQAAKFARRAAVLVGGNEQAYPEY